MLKHIDCFSGPGGITTGFKAAGIQTVLAIEKVESCVETFRANHPEVKIFQNDIRKVSKAELKGYIGTGIDIVTAGMPCETFSTAGSTSRSFYDDRQVLFREGIRVADAVDAKLILLENVPAIQTKKTVKNGEHLIIDEIFKTLKEFNYKYYIDTVLNASHFGVPQTRGRFFIMASREKRKLRFPVSKNNGLVTVSEALAGLPKIDLDYKGNNPKYTREKSDYGTLMRDNDFWKLQPASSKLTYHVLPNHRLGTIERFSLIKPGEGLRDLFKKFNDAEIKELQANKILPKKWYIQRNRRLENDKPSVTVTSHCLDELVHPDLNRALTVREAARLQSFPDSYDFKGGPFICPHLKSKYENQDKYEQVGDAVPPLMAYHIGVVIKEILEND